MTDFFYTRFESRFRGSGEAIKQRLAFYPPLIEPLRALYPDAILLDLGCGRGEWLALAQEVGWKASGVDMDGGMLQAARELGLDVHQADLLDFLRKQPSDSVSVVTSFQVAEHLPFEDLQELFQQARRVLLPGGVMILETPNPENISVGTCSFYLDPSHVRPLPPELLSFLATDSGFPRVSICYQPAPQDFSPSRLSMQGLVYGVSPDYAIFAQKEASPEALASLSWPLHGKSGCSLFEGAAAYDHSLHRHLDGVAARLDEIANNVERISIQIDSLTQKMNRLDACQQELKTVYGSRSWQITAPLRTFNLWAAKGKMFLVAQGRSALLNGAAYATRYPRLHAGIRRFADRIPGLRRLQTRLLFPDTQSSATPVQEQVKLSPAETSIYHEIKDAIARRGKGVL